MDPLENPLESVSACRGDEKVCAGWRAGKELRYSRRIGSRRQQRRQHRRRRSSPRAGRKPHGAGLEIVTGRNNTQMELLKIR